MPGERRAMLSERFGSAAPWSADHRPWPPPARPWTMWQVWHDLLFAHWPVDAAEVSRTLPPGLALDRREGQAWLGVVPFRMSGIRLRQQPAALPWLGAFPELNVRTYVTVQDGDGVSRPGVFFYSLDAGNPLAVLAARRLFHLPYFNAAMRCRERGGAIHYRSVRRHRGAPPATFHARYRPTGPPAAAAPGSLADWLTARYCLYAADAAGRLYRGEIHHRPWPLQEAEAALDFTGLVSQHGLTLPSTPPLLHFSRRLDVVVWSLASV